MILCVYSWAGLLLIWAPLSPIKRRKLQTKAVQALSRIFLKVLGIRVEINGETHLLDKPLSSKTPGKLAGKLIVANHVSTLDMVAIVANYPCVFSTSVEIEQTPVLGFWAKCSGSIFIERRHRERLEQDIQKIRDVLADGMNVIVFPEGTSTNGSEIKRFKQGFFNSILAIHGDVQPICIQYLTLGGEKVSAQNRDRIFYYGDLQIGDHLKALFTNPRLEMKLTFLNPISSQTYSSACDLANDSREKIEEVYHSA